jgi:hypothetical protein
MTERRRSWISLITKPKLKELTGKPVPEEMIKGQRFAFLKGVPNLVGTPFEFGRHGKSGAELSELLPYTAQMADDIAIVRSMHTEAFNHDPATTFINTGSTFTGGLRWVHGSHTDWAACRGVAGVRRVGVRQRRATARHASLGKRVFTDDLSRRAFRSQGDPCCLFQSEGVSATVRRQSLDAGPGFEPVGTRGHGRPGNSHPHQFL